MKNKFVYLVLYLCADVAFGFDKRLQSANLDFLNVESNNPKVTPPPAPKQTGTSIVTPSTAAKPTTGSSNVRQLIKNFNDRITDNEKPQVNKNPITSTTSKPTVIQPKPSTVQQKQEILPPKPTIASKDPFPSLPNTPTKPSGNFPGLPNSGGATSAPNVPNKPMSWSSVVSGNKASSNAASQVPTKPTNTVNPVQIPAKPTIPSNSNIQVPVKPPSSTSSDPTPGGPEIATDAELKEISELLFKKENSLAKFFTINLQGKTTSFSKDDLAPQPLIQVQPEIWNVPTVAAMKALLDNYEQNTTVNEVITPQERNEENTFLDLVMATPVMRQLMLFLKDKGGITPDPKQHRDLVKQIWFNMYSRGQGRIGSSGFEHIFLSEIKNNEISGLHNWIYFHTEENSRNVNYLGYMKKLNFNDKSGILKLHFTMKGIDKPVDTIFFGTSPELELSLYTLCYVTRKDQPCPLANGQQQFNLRTHNYRYRSKNMIGSAFPEI